MKIAIPKHGDQVSLHYGHSEGYMIYDIDDNKVITSRKVMNGGIKGCEAAALLSELEVDTIITGGIGENAKRNLEKRNIHVIVGATGSLDDVINQYLNDQLILDATLLQAHDHRHHHNHSDEESGHSCCGGHENDEDHKCCGRHHH